MKLTDLKPLDMYNRLSKLPLGKQLFTKFVCMQAPYFASISPLITELRPNYAEVTLRKHRAVTNHLNTVHAIAMCNMAEIAGGMMTEVTVPPTHRWIPTGMTVKYLKKAETDLTAIATPVEPMNTSQPSEFHTNVSVIDRNGEPVFHAVSA